MKTVTAAIALPMALASSVREALAQRRAAWAGASSALPVPAYEYDSRTRRTRFFKYDDNTRAAFAYLNAK